MKTLGRLILVLGLLTRTTSGLHAQAAADSPDGAVPPVPGYAPEQYVPLYRPVPPGGVPDDDAVLTKRPADEPAPEPPSFRPPIAAPRTDSGFAPVVNAPPTVDRQLVDSGGGVPRLYAPGFRLGPFDVRPDATVQGTYNDNIYLSPAGVPRFSDYIFTLSPSVTVSYENGLPTDIDSTQFSLNYMPSILEFTQNTGNSSVNQSFNASVAHRFSKLRVSASQTYAHTSGGVIQAGDLVDHDAYVSSLDVSYALTPKVSAELSSSYLIDRFSTGIGSDEVNALLYANYEVRPKLTLSIAPYIDDLMVQQTGGDQLGVGAVVRANYVYSERTAFYGQIGGGERQYGGSFSNQEWTYAFGATWQAAVKTLVELTASRKTDGSVTSANSDYTDSSMGITLQQALIYRVTGILAGSYDHADYFSTLTGADQQTYDFFSITPSLVFHPSIWADVGVSYSYRQNISNVKSSEFDNNQVNVFSTVRF